MRHTLSRRRSDRGWTIIELLVVLSLIMILATVAMNQYNQSILRAREATLKSNLFRVRDAIDQYFADKGNYPSSIQTLVSEGYLRAVPMDTITQSTDTWTTVAAETDPSRPTSDAGIYDIHSGSDGTSLDGTRYADWD
jgi:general secretion pathway protein G